MVLASTGHAVTDDLVCYRVGKTLAARGFHVVIMGVPGDSQRPEEIDSVPLRGLGRSRIARVTVSPIKFLAKTALLRPDLVLIFTPDLLPAASILKSMGIRVIYYAVENYSAKLRHRSWIPGLLRPIVAEVVSLTETLAARVLDGVVTTDSRTASRFRGARQVVVLPNYPNLELVDLNRLDGLRRSRSLGRTSHRLVYAGTISPERGLRTMVQVVDMLPDEYELHLYGWLTPGAHSLVGKNGRVVYHGAFGWPDILYEIASNDIGMCLFDPGSGYDEVAENTTKLFEYMLCGLPVIAADFPGLRAVIERHKCGVCVDPTSAESIARAVKLLAEDQEGSGRMGQRGRLAVMNACNWKKHAEKLVRLCGEWLEHERDLK